MLSSLIADLIKFEVKCREHLYEKMAE
jgi:hypothetical protein